MSKNTRIKLQEERVLVDRYRVLRKIGSGSMGTVYQVEQLGLGVSRALKALDPDNTHVSPEELLQAFRQEVALLSELTHPHITKILDFDSFSYEDTLVPFFVMEFANGGLLAKAIPEITTRENLYVLIDQILDAVEYLHACHIMHGDIKPQNLLVHYISGRPIPAVKLTDLGVAKLIGQVTTQLPLFPLPNTETYLWATPCYAPPEVYDKLKRKERVSQDWIRSFGEQIDEFLTGITIVDLLSSESVTRASPDEIDYLLENLRPNIRDCLTKEEEGYLRRWLKQMTAWRLGERFSSISAARSTFSRISPGQVSIFSIPELTGIGCLHEVAHGGTLIPFSSRMAQWINHPAFQRLHKLNQLNFVYLIYPGARHSRFSHSVECFELARNVALHLLNDSAFRFLMGKDDILTFLASSLLHDTGHFPLAHTIEELRPPMLLESPTDLKSVRADYEMVEYFLRREFGEAGSLWDMLAAAGIDPVRLVGLVSKQDPTSAADSVIQCILDGPVDVDKISYLRHDSTCSFIRYGAGIDVEGILDNLVVLLPSDYPKITKPKLGILRAGISAAESIITARYYMFSRVYWHRVNRAVMSMISDAVRRLMSGDKPIISFETFIEANWNSSDWEALAWISDQLDRAIDADLLPTDSQRPLGNSLKGIVNSTRQLYKRLITFWPDPDNANYKRCHDFLMSLSRDQLESLRVKLLELIASHGIDSIQDQELLIDSPRARKEHDVLETIWVLDKQSGSLSDLANISPIAQGVYSQFQSFAKRSRIFVSPRLYLECEQIHGLKEEIVQALLGILKRRP